MTINKFIEELSKENTDLGDLCKDLLKDSDFPENSSDDEKLDFIKRITSNGLSDIYERFIGVYKVMKHRFN